MKTARRQVIVVTTEDGQYVNVYKTEALFKSNYYASKIEWNEARDGGIIRRPAALGYCSVDTFKVGTYHRA